MRRKKVKKSNRNKLPRINTDDEVITMQDFIPLFEDLREFIKSTAKEMESSLIKEIRTICRN